MKIIGVTGMSGAGKTTFSNLLGERKNVGVIHLDNLINGVKDDKFKKQLHTRSKNNDPVMFPSKVHVAINNNRFLFRTYCFIKKQIIKDKIDEEIKRFKVQGKDAVVIDSCYLLDLVDKKKFDSIICVKRPYAIRVKAVMEREKETESKIDMVTRDMPYKRKISKGKRSDYDYIVINTLGIDELKEAAQKIYDETVGIKTFDEQIRVEKTFKGLKRKMAKVVTLSRHNEFEELGK